MGFPFAAMGIGALIGGMTSKQRGGNFLKGALQGAALGGIGGMFGSKAAGRGFFGSFGGSRGMFGLGTKMMPNMLALAGIGVGSEMLGQSDANKQRMLQQRRWLDEEEDRRIARLNKYAGYDVSKARLTPSTYFMADGGITNMPQYANGGWHNVPGEEPGPTQDPEIMRLPMGQEGSFEEENEGMVGLELAGLTDDEMAELQALQSLSIVTPEGDPNYERIQLRLQELMGRMKVAKGGQINRPGYAWGGSSIANQGFDTSGGETWQQAKATQMNDPGLWTDKWFDQRTDMAKDYNQLLQDRNRLGEAYIDRSGVIDTEEKFFNQYPNIPQTFKPFEDLDEQMRIGEFPKKAPEGYFEQYNLAQGGIADLDMRGGGHSIGPGTGTSDDVPAMLSDGEFVMTANAVRNLGGGDRMVGAQRMYNMMNSLDPNSQTPGEMNVAGYG